MVRSYIQAKKKKHTLLRFHTFIHIFKVKDDEDEICCLFKKYTIEKYVIIDVFVYYSIILNRDAALLLQDAYDYLLSTVFIRTKDVLDIW